MRALKNIPGRELECLISAMRLYHGNPSLNEDEAEPALALVEAAEAERDLRTAETERAMESIRRHIAEDRRMVSVAKSYGWVK